MRQMKHKSMIKKKEPKKIIKKEFLFLKSFHLAKSNLSKTGLMVLFDVLFLIAVFGLQNLIQYFAQSLALPKTIASAITFIIFSLIYYLILLFIYSFFKYCILDFIKSLSENKDFSFKRLGEFYALNIVIGGVFFAIMLLLNSILAGIKQDYAPFVFIVLAVPYLLFLYIIANTSHSLFYQEASIKESIKKSLKITFTKIKTYRETILVMILFALVLWLLFYGAGYLVRTFTSKNYSLYLTAYAYFKQISIIVFDLVFYIVILINRISFYALAKE